MPEKLVYTMFENIVMVQNLVRIIFIPNLYMFHVGGNYWQYLWQLQTVLVVTHVRLAHLLQTVCKLT